MKVKSNLQVERNITCNNVSKRVQVVNNASGTLELDAADASIFRISTASSTTVTLLNAVNGSEYTFIVTGEIVFNGVTYSGSNVLITMMYIDNLMYIK